MSICCIPDKKKEKEHKKSYSSIGSKTRHHVKGFNSNLVNVEGSFKDKDIKFENKDFFYCTFICGLSRCKHENWINNPKSAIKGLNCDLVAPGIFASQRPCTKLIKEYNLIDSFLEKNIGMIINLQIEGEHAYCGPNEGLEKTSGFSYDPEVFISSNIQCKLCGWEDMDVPDSRFFVLEIVKEIATHIKEEEKNVLVHCHAGFGRTGVIIACYLIFESNHSAEEVIESIRTYRSNLVQRQSQYEFCLKFRKFIDKIKEIFMESEEEKKSLEYFMTNQKNFTYGSQSYFFPNIPKLLQKVLERIIVIKNSGSIQMQNLYKSMYNLETWNNAYEETITLYKLEINKGEWNILDGTTNILILSELLYDWISDNLVYVINPKKIDACFEKVLVSLNENEYVKVNLQTRSIYALNDIGYAKRVGLQKHINKVLTKYEVEILTYISNFLCNIFPDISEEDISGVEPSFTTSSDIFLEFENVKRRIAFALLGFNYTSNGTSGNFQVFGTEKEEEKIAKILELFEFFSFTLIYDSEKTTNSGMKFSTFGGKSNLQPLTSEIESLPHLMTLEKLNYGNKLPKKDKFLFNMFKELQFYFNNPKNFEYINDFDNSNENESVLNEKNQDEKLNVSWMKLLKDRRLSRKQYTVESTLKNDLNEEKLLGYYNDLNSLIFSKNDQTCNETQNDEVTKIRNREGSQFNANTSSATAYLKKSPKTNGFQLKIIDDQENRSEHSRRSSHKSINSLVNLNNKKKGVMIKSPKNNILITKQNEDKKEVIKSSFLNEDTMISGLGNASKMLNINGFTGGDSSVNDLTSLNANNSTVKFVNPLKKVSQILPVKLNSSKSVNYNDGISGPENLNVILKNKNSISKTYNQGISTKEDKVEVKRASFKTMSTKDKLSGLFNGGTALALGTNQNLAATRRRSSINLPNPEELVKKIEADDNIKRLLKENGWDDVKLKKISDKSNGFKSLVPEIIPRRQTKSNTVINSKIGHQLRNHLISLNPVFNIRNSSYTKEKLSPDHQGVQETHALHGPSTQLNLQSIDEEEENPPLLQRNNNRLNYSSSNFKSEKSDGGDHFEVKNLENIDLDFEC